MDKLFYNLDRIESHVFAGGAIRSRCIHDRIKINGATGRFYLNSKSTVRNPDNKIVGSHDDMLYLFIDDSKIIIENRGLGTNTVSMKEYIDALNNQMIKITEELDGIDRYAYTSSIATDTCLKLKVGRVHITLPDKTYYKYETYINKYFANCSMTPYFNMDVDFYAHMHTYTSTNTNRGFLRVYANIKLHYEIEDISTICSFNLPKPKTTNELCVKKIKQSRSADLDKLIDTYVQTDNLTEIVI